MGLSTFLNGRGPTRLRGLQMLALSDTGQVLTRTYTDDSGGGASQAWTPGGTVQCRIDPIGDRADGRIAAGRIDERSTHRITTTAGVAVEADDRFAVTGRGTFEVTATLTRTDARTEVFEVVPAT